MGLVMSKSCNYVWFWSLAQLEISFQPHHSEHGLARIANNYLIPPCWSLSSNKSGLISQCRTFHVCNIASESLSLPAYCACPYWNASSTGGLGFLIVSTGLRWKRRDAFFPAWILMDTTGDLHRFLCFLGMDSRRIVVCWECAHVWQINRDFLSQIWHG